MKLYLVTLTNRQKTIQSLLKVSNSFGEIHEEVLKLAAEEKKRSKKIVGYSIKSIEEVDGYLINIEKKGKITIKELKE